VSDSLFTKLVVTVIMFVVFAAWLSLERYEPPDCGIHCPTDLSASRKPARH
jgi:hypothetical protein